MRSVELPAGIAKGISAEARRRPLTMTLNLVGTAMEVRPFPSRLPRSRAHFSQLYCKGHVRTLLAPFQEGGMLVLGTVCHSFCTLSMRTVSVLLASVLFCPAGGVCCTHSSAAS